VASDSEAFVDMANSIVGDLRSGVDPEAWRPFKLRSDGDLWAHFTKVVCAKGFDTVAFTWVKGHATEEHVRAGITTETHKHGNLVADQVADIGTQLHGKDIIDIAGWYHTRYRSYLAFMRKVTRHIVEGYLIHRALLENSDHGSAPGDGVGQRGCKYQPLEYADPVQTSPLKPSFSLANYAAFKLANPYAMHVQGFLANLEVVRCVRGGRRPITWVELFVLYIVRGFEDPTPTPTHAAQVRPNPDKQIKCFKNLVRGIVARVFDGAGDADMFRPATPKPGAFSVISGSLGKYLLLLSMLSLPTLSMLMLLRLLSCCPGA